MLALQSASGGMGMAVLIVDDDDNVLLAVRLLLKSEAMDCIACRSPQQALIAVKGTACQLALVDLNYIHDTTSGKEGLALITALRESDPDMPVIAMTGWGTIGIAVEAMRRGAVDFIEKPWDDNQRLLHIIRTQMRLRATRRRVGKFTSAGPAAATPTVSPCAGPSAAPLGESPQMVQLLLIAQRVAGSPIPILITGENGTGKSLLAEYIHRHSSQSRGPFISVNMGSISETTFESEMFGHVKGAFTDAKAERVGRVELADQGTLFMDEIANMPLSQQAKILRLLEERSFEKLGSSYTQHASVRFISATNADLHTLVAKRGFRQDLLYRLNGVTLEVPPLRARGSDVLRLATFFLERARRQHHGAPSYFSDAACRALQCYAWPGNVRELQHVVERSVLLAQGECIGERDLQLTQQPAVLEAVQVPTAAMADMTLDQAEGWFIRLALTRNGGNVIEAARELGISRSALYRRLGKLELS
jgi:DNA-binding NtrC family response regulator